MLLKRVPVTGLSLTEALYIQEPDVYRSMAVRRDFVLMRRMIVLVVMWRQYRRVFVRFMAVRRVRVLWYGPAKLFVCMRELAGNDPVDTLDALEDGRQRYVPALRFLNLRRAVTLDRLYKMSSLVIDAIADLRPVFRQDFQTEHPRYPFIHALGASPKRICTKPAAAVPVP